MKGSTRAYLLCLCFIVAAGVPTTDGHARTPRNQVPSIGAYSGSNVAFLLSISGQPQGVVPVSVSELRAAVSRQLTVTLSRRGAVVTPQERIMPLMRAWRVRDGRSIPRAALDSLATGLDVRLLLVANLIVQRNRVIVTGRFIDPVSASLLGVAVTETSIDPRPGAAGPAWLRSAREAAAMVASATIEPPAAPGEPLLILDTQPVGCPAGVALIAGHALFERFVEASERAIIDPAVVNSTLHDAGHSERYIGAEARALLVEAFACSALMAPQLISYAPAPRARTQVAQFDELVDEEEALEYDYALNLRLIDLTSGTIVAGNEAFLAVPPPAGWFGVPREDTLMKRLQVAAGHLWSDMQHALEGF